MTSYGSLSDLTLLSDLAAHGVVRAASEEAGVLALQLEVTQTLWSQPGGAPVSGTIRVTQALEVARGAAPAEGEQTIVFLTRSGDGNWVVSGGAKGRFRVDDGLVTPVADDGVSVPAGTDVADFVALLAPPPAPEEPGTDYGPGYGYGGGSY